MAFAATVFWLLNALLSICRHNDLPMVYLVSFNLAFATYAFVDVVCDALMVTYGRRDQDRSGLLSISSGRYWRWPMQARFISAAGCRAGSGRMSMNPGLFFC